MINLKKCFLLILAISLLFCFSGCTQDTNVRRLTVVNCTNGDVLFQLTGKFSFYQETRYNRLIIEVDGNGQSLVHYVGLCDSVSYVVEDLSLG